MSTAKITRFDLEVIEEKLIGLKSALLGLGESF